MKRLSEFRKDYDKFSGKASDVSRQLSFAGLGIVWIFRIDINSALALPSDLMIPTLLFAISLGFDLLHYICSSLIWGMFHRYHELRASALTPDPKLVASPFFNWPALFFFWTKLAASLSGYGFLVYTLYTKLFP